MAERLQTCKSYIDQGYCTQRVIKFSSVANSTWYKHKITKKEDGRKLNKGRPIPGYTINPNGEKITDQLIVIALKELRQRIEFNNAGGCKKLRVYLQRKYQYFVSEKKIYRLCKENKLLLPKRKKQTHRRGRTLTVNRIVTRPNQVWEFDLKYGIIQGKIHKRFFYIVGFIDVYTRYIEAYHIGLKCKAEDIIFALKSALKKHKTSLEEKLIIRSDNGTQMTSNKFRKAVEAIGKERLLHEFIPLRDSNKNAHIESFNSILEIEFLGPRKFNSYSEAYSQTVDFMDFYNNERVHGSLANNTPQEAKTRFGLETAISIEPVHL